ncbi:hypothetical protein MMC30_001736 [Trapelia coarctata]|nr:hypothetical protein [Trapelia coarctata]
MAALLLKSCLFLGALSSVLAEAPKVVQMQTYRQKRETIPERLLKRANFPVTLGNAATVGLYYVNATVGTPPQEVSLQIDTGSSDVWMFGPRSCNASTSPCLGGDFDVSASSTSKVLSEGTFSIRYVTPGSGIVGNYVSDEFSMGGMKIKQLTMAVATDAKFVPTGIMGIGFNVGESIVQSQGVDPYPNIIDELVAQKLTNTRAYSLWLNDLGSSSGTILFGGYDTAKFTGDLTALQIQPDSQSGNITSMTVAWTSLSLTDPSSGTTTLTTSDFIAPAILDSGTTLTGLPTALYEPLAAFAGVVDDPDYGAVVNCNISNYPGTLNYGFGGPGGPSISVPFYELAIPATDLNGAPLTFRDGSPACTFGLFPIENGQSILFGDTFLRSAYVVYDLDNLQIAIAPTVFNTTKSSVVEITSGSGTGASSVVTGITAKQTATKVAVPGIAKTATVTALGTAPALASFGALSGVRTATTGSSTASATTKSAAGAVTVPAFDGGLLLMVAGTVGMMLMGGVFFVWA